ncbi:hypothetical protein [Caulifigura coniformis]|uniref:hypothetical protein n=1 Tax=Caulifigura coniformis TaxID=2527983 RepID=UPI0011A5A24D|nr:hypothetical protein [Caulifigura coniformis]
MTLPSVDPGRLRKRCNRTEVRFSANVEIPLVDAVYLQKSFGESSKSLECFVSLAVQNGLNGRRKHPPLSDQELWVTVTLQVSLPLETVRRLNELTVDPELLAGTLTIFIREEIEERKMSKGAWARKMRRPELEEAFAMFGRDA